MKKLSLALLAAALAAPAFAQNLQITEWMYSSTNGEFIEITNTGLSALDLSAWSFDDDSRLAGSFGIGSLGLLQAGESAIITEAVAADFRAAWGLGASVKIVGGNSQNLARNDEINFYTNLSALADRLAFGDQTFAGTPRTQNKSTSVPFADLGLATASTTWTLAATGDAFGSWASSGGDVGNPGVYLAIPEPSTYAALLGGLAFGVALWRRRTAPKA